jgi:hypothetical protein
MISPQPFDQGSRATPERELTSTIITGLSLHEESHDRQRPKAEV